MRTKPAANNTRWNGPYLQRALPQDPWGNDYRYELVNAYQYRIWSLGPDGIDGTEDDIVGGPTELQSPELESPEAETSIELMVELEMLDAQKKVMEDEIAEARAAGSGLDAIVEGELRRINEEIAELKQKQKDSDPTAEGNP